MEDPPLETLLARRAPGPGDPRDDRVHHLVALEGHRQDLRVEVGAHGEAPRRSAIDEIVPVAADVAAAEALLAG